ncbi:hypothetical protein HY251_20885, partial [bacterium]|nr:hypothetical protein [bacterium]
MRYVGPKGEPFVDLGYSYDRANNRLSETRFHEGREDHFSYDSVYRLAGAQYGLAAPRTGKGDKDDDHEKKSPLGVSAETFVFDGVGNRTSLAQTLAGSGGEKEKHEDHDKGKHDAVPTVTTSYATNSVNEYTSVGGLLQGHDPSGNLLDDGRFTYRYDFRNLLVELRSKKTGTVAHYRYDALGRRIEKTFTMGGAPGDDDEREDRDDDDRASAGTRRYVYDGARILEERTDDHFAGKEWVYGVGLDEPVRMVHRRA